MPDEGVSSSGLLGAKEVRIIKKILNSENGSKVSILAQIEKAGNDYLYSFVPSYFICPFHTAPALDE
ncbi:MAG: hypothetical protein AMJ65_15055 [Phycisphaerae bacterium SG8_4]|nr:MAG: hypothetical protein AMJ65_15055 [Phycisphaerae bacterium SG8_4]